MPDPAGETRSEAGPAAFPASSQKRAQSLSLYYKARRLEQEADDDSALAVYLQAAALDPLNPRLSRRITEIYARNGRLNEALELLEKSTSRGPKDPELLLSLARFLEKHHHESPEIKHRARRTAEQLVEEFPDYLPGVRHLVRYFLADQQRDKAQAVITRALASDSKNPFFWLGLTTPARNCFPLDDRSTYEKHFVIVSAGILKALALAPDDPGVMTSAGDFFAANREPRRALELYQKVADRRPGDLQTRRKLGQLLRMTGREQEATALFETLVTVDPGDLVAHRALIALHQKTSPDKSLTHRAEVLRLESGDPRDYTAAAQELLRAGRTIEALTLVKRGIFFNPRSPQLLQLHARVLSEKGDHLAALEALARTEPLAQERAPRLLDSAFYHAWGATAQRAGNTAEAETRYRQSIGKAPAKDPGQAAPAYHDLGFLWLTLNKNTDAAGELLRTANSLVKDHPPYLGSLGWWHFLKKDYPAAVTHLSRAVSLAGPDAPQETKDHLSQAQRALAETSASPAGTPAPASPGNP